MENGGKVFPNFCQRPFDLTQYQFTQDLCRLNQTTTMPPWPDQPCYGGRSPSLVSSSTSAQEWRWVHNTRYLHSNPKVEIFSDHQHEHVPLRRTRAEERAVPPPHEVLVVVAADMFCSGETITKFCVDLLVDKARPQPFASLMDTVSCDGQG